MRNVLFTRNYDLKKKKKLCTISGINKNIGKINNFHSDFKIHYYLAGC